MDQGHILSILYEMALAIGGEVSVKPLLAKTLQRLLYHTSFPAGFVCLDMPAAQVDAAGMVKVRIDAAIGDFELSALVGQRVRLPARLLLGKAERAEDAALLAALPDKTGPYTGYLRLPVEGEGVIVLLAPELPDSDLPLTQLFQPLMANLARAIVLCRSHDAYTGGLIAARDASQQALAASEEKFRTLSAAVIDALIMVDDEGELVYWNPAAERILGYRAEEALGKSLHELLTPARYRDAARHGFQRFRGSGQGPVIGQTIEIEALHKDGHELPVELSISALKLNGRWHAVGLLRDVTLKKRLEEELRQAGVYNRSLIEASLDPLVTINAEGKVTDVNRATEAATGRSRSELIGTDFSDYFTEPERARAGYQQVFLEGSVTDYPLVLRHRNGQVTEVLYNASVYRDEAGQVLGVFAAARDVTERNRNELELAHLNRQIRLILDSAGEGIYGLDGTGRCTFANPAAARLLGYTVEEMIGQPTHEMFHYKKSGDAPYPEQECPVHAAYRLGAVQHGTDLYWRKDGSGFPVEFVSTPILEEGVIHGAVVTFNDITERRRMEDSLRQNEQFLESLVEHIPNMVFVKDARELRFIRFNKAGEELLGYARSEMLGKNDYDFFPKEQADFFTAKDRAILGGGELLDIPEEPISTRNRGLRYLHTRKIPIYADDGSPLYLLGISEDITERKREEEQLRRSESSLAEAQRIAHLGSWHLDLATGQVFWSEELYRMYGYDPAFPPPLYSESMKLFTPESWERLSAAIAKATESGIPYELELEMLPKDGRRAWMLARGELMRDAQGRPTMMRGVVMDITGRKQAEIELLERDRHTQSLLRLSRRLEQAQDYQEILDAARDEVRELLGYQSLWAYLFSDDRKTAHALVAGGPLAEVILSAEGTLTLNVEGDPMLEEIAAARQIVLVEDAQSDPRVNREIVAALGSRTIVNVPILLFGQHLGSVGMGTFGAEGVRVPSVSEQEYLMALASHMAVSFDRIHLMQERDQAEGAVRQLNRELEQRVTERTAQLEAANKELEAFAYSVSHDLRTPLRAIDGFSRILLEDYADRLDAEGKRLFGVVRDNAMRMNQLIDDILKFSRAGRLDLAPVELDMEQMARGIVAELRAGIPEADLQVEIEPLPRVKGDGAMLRQVLVNLISNAIKFSRQRKPAVIRIGGAVEGDEVVYSVRDNGAGFDMQYADRLFGVFQRLHSETEFEGTGIGLAIVKRIVMRHGGRVWAEGKVNEGATFYFALPHAAANG